MALQPGDKLGPYEIVAPIGKGGMGEVYRAHDPRLKRNVAIKVCAAQFSERFEREAQAIAALNHSNICQLYDVGPNYLVMEYIEGTPLKGPFPIDQALKYAAQICDALDAAHKKGITHRDLKPANILVTKAGIKLLDFGLAKLQTASLEQAPKPDDATLTMALTGKNEIVGTLYYMSPEQLHAQANGQEIDARSDIFSFGLVLYEMLTGKRAFEGSSPASVIAAIMERAAPSIADVAPAALDRVLKRCLEKDPAERFQSAQDLAFALRSISGEGEQKPMTPRNARFPLRAAIAIAAVLAVLAGAGWFFWRSHTGQSIDSLAVLPFVNASGSPDTEYLSDGITESLMDSLSELPNLKVMSHSAVFRYKGKEADARAAGHELGVRAVLTGRITQRGDNLSISAELVDVEDNSHLWGEQYNRKLADALAVQNEIAAQISDKLRRKLSDQQKTRLAKRQTENPEAYQLYLKGRFYTTKFTQEGIEKGLDYFRQAIALDPNYALAYGGISYNYGLADDVFIAPHEAMPKAKEAARKAVELDDTLAEGHVDLGTVYFLYDYDWPAAEREFRRAVELNPNYAPAHEFLGWYLVAMGKTEEGLDHSRRAVALDPLSVEIASNLGWCLYFARQYDQAVAESRKSIDLEPEYWASYFYVGQVYAQQSHFDEAIAAQQKARKLEPRNLAPLGELARVYALAGRSADSRRALAELVAGSRRQQLSKQVIAVVYTAMGDKDQALAHVEQAYRDHSLFMALLKVDPEMDSLRSASRFQDLMRRMNFPP